MTANKLCLALTAVALTALSTSYVREPVVGDILVTAAHYPVNDSKYKLIYVNEELDKAYYLDTEYIPTQVQVGTQVTWTYNGNTYTGRVASSDSSTFYVLPDNPELIVTGMSGSVVSDLGFISSYTVDGLLKVVYF